MEGIINRGIRDYILTHHGEELWESVRSRAQCDEMDFSLEQRYPDEVTMELIGAAVEVTRCPARRFQIEVGRHIVPNTLKKACPTFFLLAGSNSRELLLNMNQSYRYSDGSSSSVMLPRFEMSEISGDLLVIHYPVQRHMSAILEGLIQGVACYFDEALEIDALACMDHGTACCPFEVFFPSKPWRSWQVGAVTPAAMAFR